ncbi:transcription factor Ouib [Drosophila grimshawi]|uniref:GH18577 n=1 Tax=Drosophila grimshawi TaxID=7222 RepID=B4JHZ5_DROGR|nr:transcription factor Ouib [Drosophila grimshawi]EDV92903.1 GH18577 [Drosophila grimshawi]
MLQNSCRICATDTDASKSTNLFERSARKLLRQINLLTGVALEMKSDLPTLICNNCQNDLNCAMEFRRRCLRNHRRWTQQSHEASEPKPAPGSPSTHLSYVRRSTRIRIHCPSEDEEVDEAPLSPMEVLIKVEHSGNDADRDEGVDHLDTETCNINDETANISTLDDDNYVPMPMKSKRRRRLAKSTGLKQPRIKQKLPVFFCDQCGNNVTGKSAFDRHLRKHSGIRPFQCEQCPARFLSAGELKGHQVRHTGDRNFPCRYCDRSYVNYSGRLRHERTHTNERPFVCTHCGKAFTNSYILKNHNLVHTGERLFRCDLCERSFSRPTHLKTHFRSNTHKQNVEKSSALEQHPHPTKAEELLPVFESDLPQPNIEEQAMILVTVEVPLE